MEGAAERATRVDGSAREVDDDGVESDFVGGGIGGRQVAAGVLEAGMAQRIDSNELGLVPEVRRDGTFHFEKSFL